MYVYIYIYIYIFAYDIDTSINMHMYMAAASIQDHGLRTSCFGALNTSDCFGQFVSGCLLIVCCWMSSDHQ